MKHAEVILRELWRRVFVMVFAVCIGFHGLKGIASFGEFALKLLLLLAVAYLLLGLFIDKGGRYITETFGFCIVVISFVHLLVSCEISEFLFYVALAAAIAIASRFVN